MNEGVIDVGKYKVKVLKTISEGGFGIVYLAENALRPAQKFALKKAFTQDEERYKLMMRELKFLQAHCAPPNPHLINYYDSKVVDEGNQRHCFYILIEFGPNGTLFDLMGQYLNQKKRFSEEEVLGILRVATDDLIELHQHGIIHCDIKIENFLFFNWQMIKLCDFGSVSKYNIDCSKLPKSEFYHYESQFEKQTTLMYRPPEMCDLYLGFKINTQVDMWMLGCVAFTLMFFKHPFHESSKLSIVNASFFWPEDSKYSEKLENLVRNLITPNPDLRPTALQVREILANWAQIPRIELNHSANVIRQESLAKKQIQFGVPQPQQRGRAGSRDHQAKGATPKDSFDFSGLDKWSKNPSQNLPKGNYKLPTKPVPSNKFNNFNFMNMNFGPPMQAPPQQAQQAPPAPPAQQPSPHMFPSQRSHSPNARPAQDRTPGGHPASQPGSQHFGPAQSIFGQANSMNAIDPFWGNDPKAAKSPVQAQGFDFMSEDQKMRMPSKEGLPVSAFDNFVMGVGGSGDNPLGDPNHSPQGSFGGPKTVSPQNTIGPPFQGAQSPNSTSPNHTMVGGQIPGVTAPQQLPPAPANIAPGDFEMFFGGPPAQQHPQPPAQPNAPAEPPKVDPFDPFNIDFSQAPQ